MTNPETKTAFVAIVGRPNVGKSTLLNSIVGEKIAIVSDKPQTTRNRITGIVTEQETQLVFLDTPGWHKAKTKLSDYMMHQIKDSITDVDLVLFLTDPISGLKSEEKDLLENLFQRKVPVILVLNKIDMLDQKDLMMPKMSTVSEDYNFAEVLPISAKTGEGTEQLMNIIKSYAKNGPHFFPPDEFTDQPERVIMAEIVREKLLRNLREELPHGVAVVIEKMTEREGRDLVDIDAVIICERATHKGMVIGKQGAMLKTIATQARHDMESFLDCKVNLQCWVKVKEDWRNREHLMREFGFN